MIGSVRSVVVLGLEQSCRDWRSQSVTERGSAAVVVTISAPDATENRYGVPRCLS